MSTSSKSGKKAVHQQTNELFARANAAHQKGNLEFARALYTKALQHDPLHLKARSHLAILLRQIGLLEAAKLHFKILFSHSPAHEQDCEHLSNYGNSLLDGNAFEQALAVQKKASSLAGDGNARICYNLATAFRDNGFLKDASYYFAKAKENGYKATSCDFNQGLAELAQGNYQQGFELFEARHKELPNYFPFLNLYPFWQGEDIRKKTLLLTREQGFGDFIQFLRFIPDVAPMVGKILFVTRKPLVRLIKNCMKLPRNVEILIEENITKKPQADFFLPIMSLGKLLNINEDTIKRDNKGCLTAPSQGPSIANTRQSKIGIAWCGSPTHKNDKNRSMAITDLLPILSKSHYSFYSLQYGEQNRAISQNGLEGIIQIPPWKQNDFCETAAVIAKMDMIISVDTAVVHLAGALGKPVVMFSNHRPEWRWLYKQRLSPWYQGLQIFHQNNTGSWQVPIETFLESSV